MKESLHRQSHCSKPHQYPLGSQHSQVNQSSFAQFTVEVRGAFTQTKVNDQKQTPMGIKQPRTGVCNPHHLKCHSGRSLTNYNPVGAIKTYFTLQNNKRLNFSYVVVTVMININKLLVFLHKKQIENNFFSKYAIVCNF